VEGRASPPVQPGKDRQVSIQTRRAALTRTDGASGPTAHTSRNAATIVYMKGIVSRSMDAGMPGTRRRCRTYSTCGHSYTPTGLSSLATNRTQDIWSAGRTVRGSSLRDQLRDQLLGQLRDPEPRTIWTAHRKRRTCSNIPTLAAHG